MPALTKRDEARAVVGMAHTALAQAKVRNISAKGDEAMVGFLAGLAVAKAAPDVVCSLLGPDEVSEAPLARFNVDGFLASLREGLANADKNPSEALATYGLVAIASLSK